MLQETPSSMRAVEALLGGAVDYAGLFPPAALELGTTVESFARYRAAKDAWALGRLVLPAARLAEFADRWPERVSEWPISLLLGSDYDTEMRLALDLGLRLEVVECRPVVLNDITEIRRRMPDGALLFVESPAEARAEELWSAVSDAGACVKFRTGGVTAAAVPAPGTVAAFLVACAQRGVRMKATAGLHHAIRGEYRLTYEEHSASACMHGFVNFFLAAVMAAGCGSKAQVEAILVDGEPASFSANESEIRWRETVFSADDIQRMRENLALSFGSCSFEEPMAEMRARGWM